MREIILILSSLALFVSSIWAYKTNFDYEPIIVFILGLVGILSQILNDRLQVNKDKAPPPQITSSQKQEVNFSLNVNTPETKEGEQLVDRKNTKTNIQIDSEKEDLIEMLKTKIHILFIDDDTKFSVVKILKDNGWKHTKSVIDIKALDIPKVRESHIFFVDINGVGKVLQCPHEGLDIALMLKQRYPFKKVVIYSANNKNNVFHEAWNIADFKLAKNALPYQFQNLVEKYSLELNSQK